MVESQGHRSQTGAWNQNTNTASKGQNSDTGFFNIIDLYVYNGLFLRHTFIARKAQRYLITLIKMALGGGPGIVHAGWLTGKLLRRPVLSLLLQVKMSAMENICLLKNKL